MSKDIYLSSIDVHLHTLQISHIRLLANFLSNVENLYQSRTITCCWKQILVVWTSLNSFSYAFEKEESSLTCFLQDLLACLSPSEVNIDWQCC